MRKLLLLQYLLLSSLMLFLTGCVPVMIAGTAATVSLTNDPRSAGAVIDDQTIELRALKAVSSSKYYNQSRISAISYDGELLLVGQVPHETAKNDFTLLTEHLPKVKHLFNELLVAKPLSLTTQASDSVITTKVKSKMLTDAKMVHTRIKVVTENGVVYLMGIVNQDDALLATRICENTKGVKQIVRLFEFLPMDSKRGGAERGRSVTVAPGVEKWQSQE